jgi:hypothetical protein
MELVEAGLEGFVVEPAAEHGLLAVGLDRRVVGRGRVVFVGELGRGGAEIAWV